MVITRFRDFRPLTSSEAKVSNLKMADYDKEIPFGDGVENRGVDDDDDEIEMRKPEPLRFIFAAWFRRHNLSLLPFKNLTEKHLLLKEIDEHTPLITKEVNRTKLWLKKEKKIKKTKTKLGLKS